MGQTKLLPILPTEADALLAKETGLVLARQQTPEPLRLRLLDDQFFDLRGVGSRCL